MSYYPIVNLLKEFMPTVTINNVVIGICIDCYEEISAARLEKHWKIRVTDTENYVIIIA